MIISRQFHAENGNDEVRNKKRDGSQVSLASTIDHNNLWKYKPEALHKDNIGNHLQQIKLNASLQKYDSRGSKKNSENKNSEDSYNSGHRQKTSINRDH